MVVKKQTTAQTEDDFEAGIQQAIKLAFLWLAPQAVRHQTKFKFTFGHRVIVIDCSEAHAAEGRSDVILYSGSRPLAVLELKRTGLDLKAEDVAQGLSYARVMKTSLLW